MSFFSILETLLIGPLKLVFELIFELANRLVGHPGMAIIFLSLIMNILVLPLYRRADAMQEASRDIDAKLHDGVAHIKKTFSGDERMMILQTYYRQNNYKPTSALNGSVSLLLEIPFFMAAYQFLSHLEILNGVSLGPIKDLGAPDGLLVIGGLAINVLPFLMTFINVISSALYLKGFPLKTKIQLYGMALFFLVFLYTSPSCLVFYWTLNNLFSLVKTIFYKIKNPKKVLGILTSVIGVAILLFTFFVYDHPSMKRRIFLIALGIILQLPLILPILQVKMKPKSTAKVVEPNRTNFILGGLFLSVQVGLLIPSTFIAASPQEYVDTTYFHNPLWYIVSAVCLAAGTFLVWMGVFYWLASPKGKVWFERIVWILSGTMLANYMFFGTDLGIITATLQYEDPMVFEIKEIILNIIVMIAIALVMFFIIKKWKKAVPMVLLTAIIALGGMSVVNINKINTSISEITMVEADETPNFELSKDGQNVVVIMLDRAVNEYIPYIFNEKPELKEKFAGFTHYSNTISFGGKTNFCTPPLFGGYEYTPVEMNKRNEELLVKKHNEALKVMPVLFSQNNFDVTVLDPVYANYRWIPDLSIFDEYENIDAYITKGVYGDVNQKEQVIQNNHRNFFCFSVMKSMPLFAQTTIYDKGNYIQVEQGSTNVVYSTQQMTSKTNATGLSSLFMDPYNVLSSMSQMTNITEESKNTFMVMTNDTTHEPMLLQTPDYVPSEVVDNTEYEAQNADRFILDGRELKMETNRQIIHYHANMAALIQLGNWFDYLRENDVYDNTRIILVADHAFELFHFDDMVHGEDGMMNVEYYMPLLLVKDFNSTEFTTSTEFMTNADVPVLATQGIIENPTNPFTGKLLTSDEKTAHDQYLIMSRNWEISKNNGTTFTASTWVSVKDDVWNPDNWEFHMDDYVILDEHVDP